MKTLVKYSLSLFGVMMFSLPLHSQSTSGGDNAQTEIKNEQKREKQRRKMAQKAESKADKVETSPRHGWLFSKKRKKKTQKPENEH
ncbi:MAG: hypothetical protein K0Q95_2012 [Bacteroidota bacterium]|jgi:hypothetical protein|nr:hypothetical protein [Bacteroidota bacterium]